MLGDIGGKRVFFVRAPEQIRNHTALSLTNDLRVYEWIENTEDKYGAQFCGLSPFNGKAGAFFRLNDST